MTGQPFQVLSLCEVTETFYDLQGRLVDPTAITLFLRSGPGDTLLDPQPTYPGGDVQRVSLGNFRYPFTPTAEQAGQWSHQWQATGAVIVVSRIRYFQVEGSPNPLVE